MRDKSFKDFVLDQLLGLDQIFCRGMFDGYGLYLDNKFFGIIHHTSVYFKTNKKTRIKYIKQGMNSFAPSLKQVLKNYYEVPVDVLENSSTLQTWAIESSKVK